MKYISHTDYTSILKNFGKSSAQQLNESSLEKEGNAFTAGLAKAKKGETFKVDGKTVKDTSAYDDASVKKEYDYKDNYPGSWGYREGEMKDEGLNLPSPDMQATGPTIQTVEEDGHNAAYNFSALSPDQRNQLKEYIKSMKTIKEEIAKLLGKAKGGVKMEGGNTTDKVMKVGSDAQMGGAGAEVDIP